MRILVFFDLPVVSKSDRQVATKFRSFLLNDGYYMLQYSVYCRIINGVDAIEKHIKRIKLNAPSKGSIRVMTVTERQYEKTYFIVGKPIKNEEKVTTEQLSLF